MTSMDAAQHDPADFLDAGPWIDSHHKTIIQQAQVLEGVSVEDTARRCYEFVRDEIRHSFDYQTGPVTCLASDVLRYRTGYCYAKSHLLAALLRANRIPCGLAYQRLSVGGDGAPFCIHGLNKVFLGERGWYRVDARGNRPDIAAAFCPPREQLAFATDFAGEIDLPGVYAEPVPPVVKALQNYSDWLELAENLPDVEPGQWDSIR